MDFRILGPLEVVVAGEAVPLGGAKPRAVLIALLLHPGRYVAADRLIADVWGDDPPPSAVNALQSYLSRLRRALGRDALRHHAGGYRVAAGPEQIDARRFEAGLTHARAALAGGDPAGALAAGEAALRLWRGPALLDVAGELFAQAEIARLTELRRVAEDLRVECLLALGRPAEAVARSAEVVAGEPLRERSRAQLMLGLYRAGRPAEALAVYHEVRAMLAEQFGLDPGEELQALAGAMLRQDAGLATAPAPAPAAVAVAAPVRVDAIPPGPDRFVGRDRELAEVRALLDEHRLVTVTGPGGAGKTRLAMELCRGLSVDVRLAELAGVEDGTLLEPALAQAFGLAVPTGVAGIAEAVGDRPVVLLLDNGEQLVAALAGVVRRLLAEVPGLRVLLTSRSPLSVAGERQYPVPPLPAGTAAVELFLDRAAAVAPGWTCGEAERAVVVALCERLDGLPLAVELAAAQLVALSPAQILDRLDDPQALVSPRRDVDERHRSLEGAIDATYRLLDDPQRELFARLSVFAGPFDLDAAERVAGEGDGVLAPLTGLITGSLVTVLPEAAPRRYRMLRTLRQYADRRLTPDGRADLRRRHLAWACELAAAADRALRGPDARRWFRAAAAKQDDARAALAHALEDPAHAGAALRLAGDLSWFWYRGGHIVEGLRWLEAALAAAPDAAEDDRARALTGVACLRYLAGDLPASGTAIGAALELARAGGGPATLARAAVYHTLLLGLSGRVEEGRRAGEEAHALAAACGEDWLLAEALISIGHVAWAGGDPAGAAAALDEAIEAGTRSGFAWSVSSARWMRAEVAMGGRRVRGGAAPGRPRGDRPRRAGRRDRMAGHRAPAGGRARAHRPARRRRRAARRGRRARRPGRLRAGAHGPGQRARPRRGGRVPARPGRLRRGARAGPADGPGRGPRPSGGARPASLAGLHAGCTRAARGPVQPSGRTGSRPSSHPTRRRSHEDHGQEG
ncbi:AfsR/SARP family transcriptional regulator [Dactylosporangium salmoneum]|uniref:OmpR/PhoB-type domain-containing protein n=1 Tax=Dactylosporangium salmoneum TaxID=53361 RepID=A0ABP5TB79_9ACTN